MINSKSKKERRAAAETHRISNKGALAGLGAGIVGVLFILLLENRAVLEH